MTHGELVKIAERWLLGKVKCSFAFTELACIATSEIPDAIGFKENQSILVECKATRSDFLADSKKYFRRRPEMGMGSYRFFMCPEGIVRPEDLPEKWGLVWVNEKGKTRIIAGPIGNIWSHSDFWQERNLSAELGLMTSALRRLNNHGVIPLIYQSLKPCSK